MNDGSSDETFRLLTGGGREGPSDQSIGLQPQFRPSGGDHRRARFRLGRSGSGDGCEPSDPPELLPQMLATWSPEKRVVVYCSSESCGSSREVARRLREEARLKDVFVLEGGWEAWVNQKR